MFETESEFEDEVRRIARLLWPSAEFSGSAMIDGRERDGVFDTEDAIHLVECTVSRTKLKAEQDGTKIAKLIVSLSKKHRDKVVKGWFITKDEPTADQRTAIVDQRSGIVSLSFDHFRSKLVDARTYLSMRQKYAFGSVRDPETGDSRHDLDYVQLDITDSSGGRLSLEQVATHLSKGSRFVLLGDYGAGKSSTMRELYYHLARSFWDNKTIVFPILLNLRDHHGQGLRVKSCPNSWHGGCFCQGDAPTICR